MDARRKESVQLLDITDKPISLEILARSRPHVEVLFYEIKEDDDPKFAQEARKLGLRVILISKLTEEELEQKKIGYMDVGKVNIAKEHDKKLIDKLKNTKNLVYKSNKVIVSSNLAFSSHPKYERNLPYGGKGFESIEKSETFFDDLDHFHIVKLLD